MSINNIQSFLARDVSEVTSEKNVWAFWDTGFASMPAWAQRNVFGWISLLGPEWTVRVLDRVIGSSSNVAAFIPASDLPDAFSDQTLDGQYTPQQASDMVRLPCLCRYGGIWLDVTIMLFLHVNDICWTMITDDSNPFEMAIFATDPNFRSGCAWFIAARKGAKYVQQWLNIYLEAWQGRTNCTGISGQPLFDPCHDIKRIMVEGEQHRHGQRPSGSTEVDPVDYLVLCVAFSRTMLSTPADSGFDGQSYAKSRILVLDVREAGGLAFVKPTEPVRQFQLLRTKCHFDMTMNKSEYDEAYRYTHELLRSAMLKLYHYTGGTGKVTLAHLWEQPGNEDADSQEGTFARLLRDAPLQTRLSRRLQPFQVRKDLIKWSQLQGSE